MQTGKPLDKFLPYQLSITSNAVSGRIALEYRQRYGLSVPEWRVMAVLGDTGEQTQRDLTRRTLMDKVAVNRACKVLEDRELIQRQPNEQDGRSHLLVLTAAGDAMYAEVVPLVIDMEAQLFANFSASELKQFRSLLDKVRGNVHEFDMEAAGSDSFGFG